MTSIEKMRSRPNLARIALELASYGGADADRVIDGLMFLFSARAKKPAEPAPAAADNNQRFNDLLNHCEDPRKVYNALSAFAEDGKAVQK